MILDFENFIMIVRRTEQVKRIKKSNDIFPKKFDKLFYKEKSDEFV